MKYQSICLLAVFFLVSCATSMIGMPVDPSAPIWSYNPSSALKQDIVQKTEHFEFIYEIENLTNGKYVINGTGKYLGSPVYSQGITHGATFSLGLSRKGVVVAYVYLPIMWRNLEKEVKFSKEFESPPWDFSAIAYYIRIRE